MAGTAAPTLYLVAGPNGAGKSTLYLDRIQPITNAPFINADDIGRSGIEDEHDDPDPYRASKQAAALRDRLLAERRSFVTETVFSHASKLELIRKARALGYRVMLFHVHVRDPDFSIARVRLRAHQGGHDVPDHKIRARYDRSLPLIREAAQQTDTAMVFDNSRAGQPPRWLFTLNGGRICATSSEPLPQWAAEWYFSE